MKMRICICWAVWQKTYNIKLDHNFPNKYKLVGTETSFAHTPTTTAPYVDVV
jgi:hypothetical protein